MLKHVVIVSKAVPASGLVFAEESVQPMKTNPPIIMLVIVIGAISIFAVGMLFSAVQVQNSTSDDVTDGTPVLGGDVRESGPISPAAVTFTLCVVPTVEPQRAEALDQASTPDNVPTMQPAATVVLPPTQVLVSDETFVERQGNNAIITNDNPGYLGVVVQDILNCGTQIMEFLPDGLAGTSELRVGDVIVAVNGITLSSLSGASAGNYLEATPSDAVPNQGVPAFTPSMILFNQIHQLVPDAIVTLTVQRSGEHYDVRIPLTRWPS